MKQLKTDITIVGAGLVGLTLARALSQLGFDVTLLEQRPKTDDFKAPPLFEQRAIVLSETSCNALEAYGFELQEAAQIDTVHVSEQGSFGKLRFEAKTVSMPRLARVKKAFELVHHMYERTMQSELVHEFAGATIQSVDADNSQVVFQQADIEYELQSHFIIASDGANSTVLKQLGIAQETKTFNQSALICNLTISGAHDNVAYERFMSSGPLAFLPVGENEVAMVWCMEHDLVEQYQDLPEAKFYQKLYDAFGYRFGEFVSMSKRHFHPLQATHATEQYKGKILVMGNAAHSLHPVAGQGFNLSVRDIQSLVNHLKTQPLENVDLEAMFKSYLSSRSEGQESMSAISDILPRIFTERYRPFRALRSAALLICDRVPILNRKLTEKFLGLRDYA